MLYHLVDIDKIDVKIYEVLPLNATTRLAPFL